MNSGPYRILCRECGAWMRRASRVQSVRRLRCGNCNAIHNYPLAAFIEDKGQA